MTPVVLTQGETPWNTRSEEHSSSESDAFELEVAQQLCQAEWYEDVTLDDCTEECVIDLDTAWELATVKACLVSTEFNPDFVEEIPVTPHLHRALSSKIDFDKLSK